MSFTICGLATGQQVEWYNPKAKEFQLVTDQVKYSTINGQHCAVVTITSDPPAGNHPTLAEMGGTVFAVLKITHKAKPKSTTTKGKKTTRAAVPATVA